LLVFLLIIGLVPTTASAAVEISKGKATLEVDAILKLKISGTKSKVTWKTSKKDVATVSSTGTVTAKAEGQATITATVDKKQYKCTVAVVDSNKVQTSKTYKVGDTWTVDGLWKLTFNSVTVTDERNQFSDKTPDQVVVLDYTYENLGYDGSYMDLYISSSDFKVVDENGNMGETYPAGANKYPQETPIGAKCVGAQEAYGLIDESGKITVYVEKYDVDYTKHKATFLLDIE